MWHNSENGKEVGGVGQSLRAKAGIAEVLTAPAEGRSDKQLHHHSNCPEGRSRATDSFPFKFRGRIFQSRSIHLHGVERPCGASMIVHTGAVEVWKLDIRRRGSAVPVIMTRGVPRAG